MDGTVIVAAISFAGTLIGTVGGIMASSKLTNFRLAQLEKKVDNNMKMITGIPVVEEKIKNLNRRIENIEKEETRHEYFKGDNSKDNNATDRYN